jgi:oligopeptide transport system permease protein
MLQQVNELKPVWTPWNAFVSRFTKIRPAVVAATIVSLMILLAAVSTLNVTLTPYSYDQTSMQLLAAPSAAHLMGTDELGRDLLARVIFGSRLSIEVGITTALAAFLIGTSYGALAGYLGGKVDSFMMRAIDVMYALPDLLVMILIGIIVGRGTPGILIALALVSWMGTARLARAQIMKLKHEDFVEAARAAGQRSLGIFLKHLLPNIIGQTIVALTFIIPSAILAESTLSFIGLGLAPPACSWGTLANEGWRSLRSHPHLLFFPSFFIFATVLSFNFLGDGLRDALDPRTKLS